MDQHPIRGVKGRVEILLVISNYRNRDKIWSLWRKVNGPSKTIHGLAQFSLNYMGLPVLISHRHLSVSLFLISFLKVLIFCKARKVSKSQFVCFYVIKWCLDVLKSQVLLLAVKHFKVLVSQFKKSQWKCLRLPKKSSSLTFLHLPLTTSTVHLM